jgi:nitrogen fixation protein NifU and related proteins
MLELSAAARDHFEHPRNAGELNADHPDVTVALVGEPVSGAILQLHLRIDETGTIIAARFRAYGCGWTIACGSLLTEIIQGRTLDGAARFRHHELLEQLEVPPAKLACAVLAETALKTALHARASHSPRCRLVLPPNAEAFPRGYRDVDHPD